MPLAHILLPILLQAGPDPSAGAIPDYSAEVQDRPPRELEQPVGERVKQTWLEECFELVESDPARAHVQAEMRRNSSQGPDRVLANHCLGLAATQLGHWSEARTAFLAGRDELPPEESSLRARLGTMAGNAALASGDVEGALALFRNARTEAQRTTSADLEAIAAMGAARALVSLGQLDEAEPLLKDAARLRPKDGEPQLLLATLLRRLGRLEEAQAAIAEAANRAPDDPAIGLEAGVIAVLDGRDDAARQSWQSVIDLVPDSAEAESARAYLQQLGPASTAE
ncbi:tetratricopeptide repeat protein [Altererythrobacter sp.]|uniref:tetratricopeptide repeat protein n=1 Tax=Altererythrobacter sp. TaxID=1872480 RepID=UPI003D0E3BCB